MDSETLSDLVGSNSLLILQNTTFEDESLALSGQLRLLRAELLEVEYGRGRCDSENGNRGRGQFYLFRRPCQLKSPNHGRRP